MSDAALDRESGGGSVRILDGAIATPELAAPPAISSTDQGYDIRKSLRALLSDMRRDWQLYLLLAPMIIWFVVLSTGWIRAWTCSRPARAPKRRRRPVTSR